MLVAALFVASAVLAPPVQKGSHLGSRRETRSQFALPISESHNRNYLHSSQTSLYGNMDSKRQTSYLPRAAGNEQYGRTSYSSNSQFTVGYQANVGQHQNKRTKARNQANKQLKAYAIELKISQNMAISGKSADSHIPSKQRIRANSKQVTALGVDTLSHLSQSDHSPQYLQPANTFGYAGKR